MGASGDRVDEYSSLIADYYQRSGKQEMAAEFLQRAGQGALANSAYADARQLLERALELLAPDSPRAQPVRLALAQVYFHTGDYIIARGMLLKARAVARATSGAQLVPEILYLLSQLVTAQGNCDEANGLLKESLSLPRAVDD